MQSGLNSSGCATRLPPGARLAAAQRRGWVKWGKGSCDGAVTTSLSRAGQSSSRHGGSQRQRLHPHCAHPSCCCSRVASRASHNTATHHPPHVQHPRTHGVVAAVHHLEAPVE